jgi:hypothetical protein
LFIITRICSISNNLKHFPPALNSIPFLWPLQIQTKQALIVPRIGDMIHRLHVSGILVAPVGREALSFKSCISDLSHDLVVGVKQLSSGKLEVPAAVTSAAAAASGKSI